MAYKERFYKKWWLYRRMMYLWYGILNMPHFENWYRDLRNWEIAYNIRTYRFSVSVEYKKPCPKGCDERCCR